MLLNAISLIGTTAITGILGFAFWLIAANLFPAFAVGLASAGISDSNRCLWFRILSWLTWNRIAKPRTNCEGAKKFFSPFTSKLPVGRIPPPDAAVLVT